MYAPQTDRKRIPKKPQVLPNVDLYVSELMPFNLMSATEPHHAKLHHGLLRTSAV